MGYTAGLLREKIVIRNRTTATSGNFGIDTDGIEWEDVGCYWANVTWQKGVTGLRAGSIDSYGVVEIRMRYNPRVTMRSRFVWQGEEYQILPETFHPDIHANTLQFLGQVII